jgi:hypothetical protein
MITHQFGQCLNPPQFFLIQPPTTKEWFDQQMVFIKNYKASKAASATAAGQANSPVSVRSMPVRKSSGISVAQVNNVLRTVNTAVTLANNVSNLGNNNNPNNNWSNY